MISVTAQLLYACVFLFLIVSVVLITLALNKRDAAAFRSRPTPPLPPTAAPVLDAATILDKEFDYAQQTASEALSDRHTMINFYLVFVGVVLSAIVAQVSGGAGPRFLGTFLAWLLAIIGWFYFIQVIRLRMAWHDSARAMSQIKEFYFRHAKDFSQAELREGFRWQAHTLPSPDRPWTIFFYSAMTIAFLNTISFVIGGLLLNPRNVQLAPLVIIGCMLLLGIILFAFHTWMYFAFLRAR